MNINMYFYVFVVLASHVPLPANPSPRKPCKKPTNHSSICTGVQPETELSPTRGDPRVSEHGRRMGPAPPNRRFDADS